MKSKVPLVRLFGLIVLIAAIVFGFAACPDGNDKGGGTPTPVASDYTFGNMSQTAESVTAVTITAKNGKSPGEVTNIRYNDSTTIPQAVGTYAVTFDVKTATGWNAAIGLSAGNLTVGNQTPVAGDYTFGNLEQTAGNVTAVSITPKEGKSNGDRTIYYQGVNPTSYSKSETPPTASGTYAVSFDVAAATGWNAATGLSAPNLVVKTRVAGADWTAVTDSTFGATGIQSVAYGGGKWVAVGSSGKMAYSEGDGVTWTAVGNSTFTATIYSVAYGGDRWVAVGASGGMAYSTDCATWTRVTATDNTFSTSSNIRGIAYGGTAGSERFVAVGQNGKIAYSSSGVTWTAVESSTFTATIYSVAYGGGRWVAVGASGGMAYSEDNGVTWTAVKNSTFTNNILRVAYGGGRWVAVGESGRMAYSADSGETWVALTGNIFNYYDLWGIAYGGGRWVAGGGNGKMAYSANGDTWTAVTDSTFGTNTIASLAYSGNRWVAGGNAGKMAYSVDE